MLFGIFTDGFEELAMLKPEVLGASEPGYCLYYCAVFLTSFENLFS
jgi:hypothetical protein